MMGPSANQAGAHGRGTIVNETPQQSVPKDSESWLAEAVERICAALDPLLIVQFGSRGRGTATRHSDLDLLIVAETREPPLERIGAVLRLLADSPWPVDAIVFTPAELEAKRHTPFVRSILREGKVLHERRAA